ncbi:MAG: tripartite tricarboxylate transporter TctB family protein [Gammaproteobacteria bacterium]
MNIPRVLGALTVPALAVAYALYALWEQTEGVYREDTTEYMMVLIVPVFVLAGLVVVQSLYELWRAGGRDRAITQSSTPADAGQSSEPGRYVRPAILVTAAVALVLTIDFLGYWIALSLFVVFVLLAMGARSPARIGIITTCTMIVVHAVFVSILDQPLPRGLLDGLYGQ